MSCLTPGVSRPKPFPLRGLQQVAIAVVLLQQRVLIEGENRIEFHQKIADEVRCAPDARYIVRGFELHSFEPNPHRMKHAFEHRLEGAQVATVPVISVFGK